MIIWIFFYHHASLSEVKLLLELQQFHINRAVSIFKVEIWGSSKYWSHNQAKEILLQNANFKKERKKFIQKSALWTYQQLQCALSHLSEHQTDPTWQGRHRSMIYAQLHRLHKACRKSYSDELLRPGTSQYKLRSPKHGAREKLCHLRWNVLRYINNNEQKWSLPEVLKKCP